VLDAVGWAAGGHLASKQWVVGCWRCYDATATHYLLLQGFRPDWPVRFTHIRWESSEVGGASFPTLTLTPVAYAVILC